MDIFSYRVRKHPYNFQRPFLHISCHLRWEYQVKQGPFFLNDLNEDFIIIVIM